MPTIDEVVTSRYHAYKPRFEYQISNWNKKLFGQLLSIPALFVAIQGTANYLEITPEETLWITRYLNVSNSWAVILQVVLPILITLFLIGYFIYWSQRLAIKGLPWPLTDFCDAVINAEKLESLKSLPDESIHVRNEIRYIKNHFPDTIDSLISLTYPLQQRDLIAVYNAIQKDIPWAKFEQQSDEIIRSFVGIKEEVMVRLDQGIDFDELSPIFQLIPKLQLCRTKPNIRIDDNVTLRSKEIELLIEFKRHVKSLPEMSPDPIADSVKWSQRVSYWFTKSSFITMLICWFILLLVVLPVTYASVSWILNVQGETTPQVGGAISVGIVAAAIAFTSIFYKQKRDHE